MPKNTRTSLSGAVAKAGGWTMQSIYDALMFEIEPELTSAMLPELDLLYKDETPQERKARAARYAQALRECAGRFSLLLGTWKDTLVGFKDGVIQSLKARVGAEEESAVKALESSFSKKDDA